MTDQVYLTSKSRIAVWCQGCWASGVRHCMLVAPCYADTLSLVSPPSSPRDANGRVHRMSWSLLGGYLSRMIMLTNDSSAALEAVSILDSHPEELLQAAMPAWETLNDSQGSTASMSTSSSSVSTVLLVERGPRVHPARQSTSSSGHLICTALSISCVSQVGSSVISWMSL